MIPRLGDGNYGIIVSTFPEVGLENDFPSRGRKPNLTHLLRCTE